MEEENQDQNYEEIAIIGMAGRFPGAPNIERFWENICNGIESVGPFTDDELLTSGVDEAMLKHPDFVNSGAVLEGADKFDASFFGVGKREAEIMDPQHRVFLECAWEVMEDAGYRPEDFPGIIGVFGGVAPNSYFQKNLTSRPDLLELVGHYPTMIGSEREYAISRVAFKLNLKGPAISVNTACSSSLVAIHLACQSLLSGESDMALAGGARIKVPLKAGYLYEEGGILSSDGHCRAFDSQASGTVVGSGVAIVLLKRLSEAISEGDNIYSVIKGSSVNNEGSQKIGFTAPSVPGQKALISDALAMAGVEPDDIGYIEAHGTGTSIGDPIEFSALNQAFQEGTNRKNFCAIGSVKTNIGHLDAGAGVAGVIKTALSLRNGVIPASLNFSEPNPQIDLENSPFYVNTKLKEWPAAFKIKRAGVSSFGLGGTNAHLIMEEAPEFEESRPGRLWQLIILSAKSEAALNKGTSNLLNHLKDNLDINLGDVSYTLQVGRCVFNHCRMAVCRDLSETIRVLNDNDSKHVLTISQQPIERDVVFMFSGQGSQYVNMGLGVYEDEPFFREQVDLCAEVLKKHVSLDIREILYPGNNDFDRAEKQLKQTGITQPALFTIEYALAQLWISWGVLPKAMVGHSIGEYVAACIAGVISLEDCLELVAVRGQLMQDLPAGSMLAVFLPEKELQPLLPQNVAIAAINGPSMCSVSGSHQEIENLQQMLKEKEIEARPLQTSHAFHSEMMGPIVGPYTEKVAQIRLSPPRIPVLSNVTGTWLTPDEATDPEYWARHLRQTVRFSDCIEELFKEPQRILLEVGPGQALTSLVRQHQDGDSDHIILPSTRHPKENKPDFPFLLTALGSLYCGGVPVNWNKFYQNEKRRRIPLPSYPFERNRFWVEPSTQEFRAAPLEKGNSASEYKNPSNSKVISNRQDNGSLDNLASSSKSEEIIADIWQRVLGVKNIKTNENFFDLGGDSLVAVGLFSMIEKRFGKKLPLATIFNSPTIELLAKHVEEEASDSKWSSLVRLQEGDPSVPPFFCVHSEGGNVLEYNDLAQYLKPTPFIALQAQALDGEYIQPLSVEDMASHYIQEIKMVQPSGPYYLGGFCLGGLLAFEMAQQLQREGEKIAFVGMISTLTPEYSNNVCSNMFTIKGYFLKLYERILLELSNISQLSWREKTNYCFRRFNRAIILLKIKMERLSSKNYSNTHDHSQSYILEMIADNHKSAFYEYRPQVYTGDLTLFKVSRQRRHMNPEPMLGWGKHIEGQIFCHEVTGYHKNVLIKPNVIELADKLKISLAEARIQDSKRKEKPRLTSSLN